MSLFDTCHCPPYKVLSPQQFLAVFKKSRGFPPIQGTDNKEYSVNGLLFQAFRRIQILEEVVKELEKRIAN
jgi:hypothetical protein